MRISKEIKEYLHYCEYQKKLSGLSLKAYNIDLYQFSAFCMTIEDQELSKAAISAYIQDLHKNYLPRTVKRKIASLRAFLNYLEFEEILDTNPIRKIKTRFQEPKQLPKTIPLGTIEKLLTVAFDEQKIATTKYGAFVALRNRVVLEMLFATGMRVSELCSLKKENINLAEGTIRIVGKGLKERIIQIENTDVKESLIKYQHISNSSNTFFLRIGLEQNYQTNLCAL